MSEHDLPELDADLRALLDAESELLEPPEGAFERVFERMSHTLLEPPPDGGGDSDGGDGSGGPPSHDTPSGSDPTQSAAAQTGSGSAATPATQGATTLATSTATLSLPTVAALAFALGLGAGAVGMRALGPEPEPTVRVEERIVERVVEVPVRVVETVYVHDDAGVTGAPTSPLGTAAPTAASGAVEARSTGTTHAADAGAGTAGDSAGSRDRDLADENALVSRAQAALARGRTSEALAAAAEHQRRFPRGEFVEEREALAIQALARSGNTAAAAARAERFRARYPRSMLLRAVNAAVGGSGSPPPAPTESAP